LKLPSKQVTWQDKWFQTFFSSTSPNNSHKSALVSPALSLISLIRAPMICGLSALDESIIHCRFLL
ncbi:hypothetical protein, partial [uncultured Dialister sp.]